MARLIASTASTARNVAFSAARALGQSLVASAGSQVLRLFDSSNYEGPRLGDVHLQTSMEGAGIPIIYGKIRLAGQIIWASKFIESSETSSVGGKGGGPTQTDYSYSLHFAVGLCEGPLDGIGRIWANGEILDTSDLTYRLYLGDENQLPDPIMEAVEGAGEVPAYRGHAYIVFENFPVDLYDARIPNLNFEVFRSPLSAQPNAIAPMEKLIRGVNLLPGSGETVYHPQIQSNRLGPGVEKAENAWHNGQRADVLEALDQLETQLPNCGFVSIILSWFGNDLRCGECELKPGVELAGKQLTPDSWEVAGLDRANAHLVSADADGNPVYGGTPSDKSLVALIKELKARGYKVGLYPFILMDIPSGNGLADPYGNAEQAAYPWRGRITCHPAAGQSGSVDKSTMAASQVSDFVGAAQASDYHISGEQVSYSGPVEWSLRRMILHYAALCKAADGIDQFLIGSELRGLTQVRSDPQSYPFVTELQDLVGQTRNLLGSQTRISYAADWSEYFGHQPADGSGDVFFHLDPLWADPEIDFIGIDWYAPLTDWRDGTGHLDYGLDESSTGRGLTYLQSQIEGGEGYDYYYASQADRDAQIRTNITDGAHSEDWIFAYKNLRDWWSNAHHNRPAGVRDSSPTNWAAQSKPIILTEYGAPALDKGANQPNLFYDPKSAESGLPYYSNGQRDDLIQRRLIEALLGYWDEAKGQNPVSNSYSAPMLDLEYSAVWAYDARPFPTFPARSDIWGDTENWRRGHWINGRIGASILKSVLEDLVGCAELTLTGQAESLVQGIRLDPPVNLRGFLGALLQSWSLDMVDDDEGLQLVSAHDPAVAVISKEQLIQPDEGESYQLSQTDPRDRPEEVRVSFYDGARDQQLGSTYARGLSDGFVRFTAMPTAQLLDHEQARIMAQNLYAQSQFAQDAAQFSLPPSLMRLTPGDVVGFEALPGAALMIDGATELYPRKIKAKRLAQTMPLSLDSATPLLTQAASAAPATPELVIMDLDPQLGDTRPERLYVGAIANPWPGPIQVKTGADASSLQDLVQLNQSLTAGQLVNALPAGVANRWQIHEQLDIQMLTGALESKDPLAVLNGANKFFIQMDDQSWQSLQFQSAELIGPRFYRLTGLLRGQGVGRSDLIGKANQDALAIFDNNALQRVELSDEQRELDLLWRAVPNNAPSRFSEGNYSWQGLGLRPLAPVYLQSLLDPVSGDLAVNWIRQTRIDADQWANEVPLSEESESYQLSFSDGSQNLPAQTSVPQFTLTASELASHFPTSTSLTLEIAQISARYGAGKVASCEIQL